MVAVSNGGQTMMNMNRSIMTYGAALALLLLSAASVPAQFLNRSNATLPYASSLASNVTFVVDDGTTNNNVRAGQLFSLLPAGGLPYSAFTSDVKSLVESGTNAPTDIPFGSLASSLQTLITDGTNLPAGGATGALTNNEARNVTLNNGLKIAGGNLEMSIGTIWGSNGVYAGGAGLWLGGTWYTNIPSGSSTGGVAVAASPTISTVTNDDVVTPSLSVTVSNTLLAVAATNATNAATAALADFSVTQTNVYWRTQSLTYASRPSIAVSADAGADTNDIIEFVEAQGTGNVVPFALWKDGYNRLFTFNTTNNGTIVGGYYHPVSPDFCLSMWDFGSEGIGLHLKPTGWDGSWGGDNNPTSNWNHHEVMFIRPGFTNGEPCIEGIIDPDFYPPNRQALAQFKVPLVFAHGGTWPTNIDDFQGWNPRDQNTPFLWMTGPSCSDNAGTNAMRQGFILQQAYEADQAFNAGGVNRHRYTRGVPNAKVAVGTNRLIWQDKYSAWSGGAWYLKTDVQFWTGSTGRGKVKWVMDNSAEGAGTDQVTPLIVDGDANQVQVTGLAASGNLTALGTSNNINGVIVTNGGVHVPGAASLAGNLAALGTSNRVDNLHSTTGSVTTLNVGSITLQKLPDVNTNAWTVDTLFMLGTNTTISLGTATNGYSGVDYVPTNTVRYGEQTILCTGTLTLTNPPGWFTSDYVDRRTGTNGNIVKVAVEVVPGVATNMAIVQFSKR